MADPRETVRDVMEKAYFHEHTVEHNIFVSLSLPYTMIAAGIGVSVFLVRELPARPDGAFWWASAAFLVLAFFSLIYAAYCVIGAARGHVYAYIDMNDMLDYFDNLCSYYRDQDVHDPDTNALADFQDALTAEYGTAAQHNQTKNFYRKYRRQRAFSALLGAGACLFISATALTVGELVEVPDGSKRDGKPHAERSTGRFLGSAGEQSGAVEA